jgi:hypothetical protein
MRLIGLALSLILVLILTLIGLKTFSGSSGSGSPAIFSNSSTEQQIKLCAEGRDSSYGDPPSPAQQAACDEQIADQAGGGDGAVVPIVPTTTTPSYSVPGVPAG